MFGTMEIIVILVVILLFFGSRKLPELGRALGLTAKEFKKAMKDDEIDVTESSRQARLKGESDDKKKPS